MSGSLESDGAPLVPETVNSIWSDLPRVQRVQHNDTNDNDISKDSLDIDETPLEQLTVFDQTFLVFNVLNTMTPVMMISVRIVSIMMEPRWNS